MRHPLALLVAATVSLFITEPSESEELFAFPEEHERWVLASAYLETPSGYTFVAPDRLGIFQIEHDLTSTFENQAACENNLMSKICVSSEGRSCAAYNNGTQVVVKESFNAAVGFHFCLQTNFVVTNETFDLLGG